MDSYPTTNMTEEHVASLAISRKDGRLATAVGSSLWIEPMEAGSLAIQSSEDISYTIKQRARLEYSIDAVANIKVFLEERMTTEDKHIPTTVFRDRLLRLWVWVERIESFCSESEDLSGSATWPVKGLLDAGAFRLLMSSAPEKHEERKEFCESLKCEFYDGPGRRLALTALGWASRFDLSDVVAACEEIMESERAAALAVWYGNMEAARETLQRSADYIRLNVKSATKEQDNTSWSTLYAEIVDLVALSLAGYRSSTLDPDLWDIWQKTCVDLLKRLEDFCKNDRSFVRATYLSTVLRFLMTSDAETRLHNVLWDANLSFSDRIAFACRFLSWNDLQPYLQKCVKQCQADGNVEGLVLTGIDRHGIRILQSFVDNSTDVQTAALVTSRVVLPAAWTHERKIIAEWTEGYRALLNTMQMWQIRAVFDVDRASLQRKHKAKKRIDGPATKHNTFRKGGPQVRVSTKKDVQDSIPLQLDARCNFCSKPLLLRETKDGATIEKLSKMKSILSCCPNCRNPLPRCAVCMLPLGVVNPYLRLIRRISSSATASVGTAFAPEDMSGTSSLPFAEWFTWCRKCKHGGHAHHILGWFANHDVCPVSGCGCRCHMDRVSADVCQLAVPASPVVCLPAQRNEESNWPIDE